METTNLSREAVVKILRDADVDPKTARYYVALTEIPPRDGHIVYELNVSIFRTGPQTWDLRPYDALEDAPAIGYKKVRPLYEIADDIREHWANVYFGAVPYLEALRNLPTVHDKYGHDDGKDIVIRFLSNAAHWRGPDARRIKAELKAIAGVK